MFQSFLDPIVLSIIGIVIIVSLSAKPAGKFSTAVSFAVLIGMAVALSSEGKEMPKQPDNINWSIAKEIQQIQNEQSKLKTVKADRAKKDKA